MVFGLYPFSAMSSGAWSSATDEYDTILHILYMLCIVDMPLVISIFPYIRAGHCTGRAVLFTSSPRRSMASFYSLEMPCLRTKCLEIIMSRPLSPQKGTFRKLNWRPSNSVYRILLKLLRAGFRYEVIESSPSR
jgi:hypothetical protein